MSASGRGGPSSRIGWVPLSVWARENGFRLSALGNQSTTLTRSEETLRFQNDSQVAVINGVNLWLCDPIMVRDRQACVSALDLKKSIEPILSPRQYGDDKLFQRICLDPGRGGKDTGGKVGPFMEKNFTLPLALELQTQLRAAGFKVWLTRTNDQFVDLDDRIALANHLRADLFISLHFNMAPAGEGKGVEVYCLTPAKASSTNIQKEKGSEAHLAGNELDEQNVLFGYQLQVALVKNLCAEDRGLRRARFAVLRPASMPAVLIEGGFLSDPRERQRISDPDYRSQMARAILQGILGYKKAMDRESTLKSTEPVLSQIGGRR
jgi:N-acetylmuramoyl-L-alanine amidase